MGTDKYAFVVRSVAYAANQLREGATTCFEPHVPEELKEFELHVLAGGKPYVVKKAGGKVSWEVCRSLGPV